MRKAAIFAAASLLFFSLFGCQAKVTPETSTVFVMSTDVSQQVYGGDASGAIRAVEAFLYDCEKRLSVYEEDSEISRINKMAGLEPVEISAYTFRLIERAKALSEASGGHFDLTVAPLSTLWNVNAEHPVVPTDDAIEKARSLVDHRKVILDEEAQTVFLEEEGMAIDLGGIAKGAFCTEIMRIYEEYGVDSALVSIGGNIYTHGKKPDQTAYKLGIRDPLQMSSSSTMGVLETYDEVVATSGAYERYFELDGVIYHHILDLTTGRPAESDLLSVTVICKDGALADYLSTTLFLAGKEAIPSYIEDARFSVIVIDTEKNVYVSPALRERFSITADGYVEVAK